MWVIMPTAADFDPPHVMPAKAAGAVPGIHNFIATSHTNHRSQ
jgi:hypothetical protein